MTSGKLTGIQIGIDTSDGDIKIVGLSHGAVLFESSDPHASAELTKALAHGASCTATLTPSSSIFVPLNTPALPDTKLEKILPSLLDIQIPLPLADCSYTFVKYENATVAYAVRKSDLRAQLDSLAETGCNPSRIVPASYAAWMLSLADFPPKRKDEPRAIFIAGKQQTILVSGHGGTVEKQSVFKTGASDPAKRLKLAFGGIPENLVCIIVGDEHHRISTALNSAEAHSEAKANTPQSPSYFLARALALDYKNNRSAQDANLRTAEFMHPVNSQRARKPSRYLMTALAMSSVAIILASVAAATATQHAEETSKAQLQSRLNEIAGFPIKTKGQRALQDARNAMPLHLDEAILHHTHNRIPSSLTTIKQLCTQQGIKLHHVSLDPNGLTASGVAKSADSAQQFVNSLVSAGIQATLTEVPQAVKNGSFTFFVIPVKP